MAITATFYQNALNINIQITPTVSLFISRWRCFYYLSIFLYGVWVLWTKPWLWDIKYCWYNYPHHKIERDVWYVFIETDAKKGYWPKIMLIIKIYNFFPVKLIFRQFYILINRPFWQSFTIVVKINFGHLITKPSFSWRKLNYFKMHLLYSCYYVDPEDLLTEIPRFFLPKNI